MTVGDPGVELGSARPGRGRRPDRGVELPDAVLWDMDGTLVDTEPYWMACEHELVAAFGRRWSDEDAKSIVGFDLIEAAHVLRERGGVELPPEEIVERLSSGVIARVRERVPWRPGARRLLTELRAAGVPCALVTMSWEPLAREVVGALPPGSFQAVVSGDMVARGKPDPEPYQLAARKLDADPGRCVAIEDSPTGVRSARDAGCVVLAVPNHVAIPTSLTPYQTDTLKGVTPEHLGQLLARVGRRDAATDTNRSVERAARGPSTLRSRTGVSKDPSGGGPLNTPTARRWMALALLAAIVGLVTYLAARGGDDAGDDPLARRPSSLVLHTWVPYWVLEEATSELDARADVIHQLSPFWFEATGVDEIGPNPSAPTGRAEELLERARDHDIPLVPSILDHTEPRAMAAILADPDQRAAHVDAIVAFAADGGFAGVDLDYERFAFDDGRDTWAATRPNWVAFVEELAARLHDDDRILTVSIPPVYDAGQTSDSGYWVYDYASITPHVDAIRIMAYDYSIAASDPGPIAPLDWVRRIIAGTSEASGDPSKLILGIPLYGRNWPVSADRPCPESSPGVETVTNRAVDDLVSRRNATPVYEPTLGEWTFTYEVEWSEGGVTCLQQREVFYVDDDGVQQRIQLALDADFGGVSLFAFGYDDQEVWNNIAAVNASLGAQPPTT